MLRWGCVNYPSNFEPFAMLLRVSYICESHYPFLTFASSKLIGIIVHILVTRSVANSGVIGTFLVPIDTSVMVRAAEREGQFAPGSRGPHQLLSLFLFIASLDVFEELPNRSILQGSKRSFRFSPRSPCFLPLLLASIKGLRGLILQFYPWASKTSRQPWQW